MKPFKLSIKVSAYYYTYSLSILLLYCSNCLVNCSCSSKGALSAINKDPLPLEEAITRGDLSTAKKLLGNTESEGESGELTPLGINPLTQDAYQ